MPNRYNVSVSELKKWNGLRGTVIRKGQRIYVYSTVKNEFQLSLLLTRKNPLQICNLRKTPRMNVKLKRKVIIHLIKM
ncbi:MAG: LysM peptidoglycan-binding domain-containing protein [Bacteroidetes bacterium]|nr:LysM peptidoglycan-binding domain-containing protein [Bacteroidota bacterium]